PRELQCSVGLVDFGSGRVDDEERLALFHKIAIHELHFRNVTAHAGTHFYRSHRGQTARVFVPILDLLLDGLRDGNNGRREFHGLLLLATTKKEDQQKDEHNLPDKIVQIPHRSRFVRSPTRRGVTTCHRRSVSQRRFDGSTQSWYVAGCFSGCDPRRKVWPWAADFSL